MLFGNQINDDLNNHFSVNRPEMDNYPNHHLYRELQHEGTE